MVVSLHMVGLHNSMIAPVRRAVGQDVVFEEAVQFAAQPGKPLFPNAMKAPSGVESSPDAFIASTSLFSLAHSQ